MLSDIVRFEWRFHTRQISFVAAAVLFFVFGFALTATGFGPSNVHIDSPYSIAQSIGLLSLFSVFVLAVFCANAVVRDRETGMEEIVFTTSVEKLPFLLGRFTGSFLAAFTAFSTSALGMFVARFMPWHEADRVGDMSVLPYLWALLVIALPNMLFAAVVLFGLATVTRSVLASYAGSVLLYVLYFVAAAMTNSPLMAASSPAGGGSALAALLDPFALSAFFEQTQHWTAVERNARLVGLSGRFAANRVMWIGAAVVGLGAVYRAFSFRVTSRAKKAAAEPPHSRAAARLPRSEIGSAVGMELRAFLLTKPFIAIAVLWAGLIAFELISDLTGGEYGAALYPTTGLLLATIRQPLAIVATILLIYVSAEMVWRERAVRFAGILNATPSSNAVFVLAKCAALSVIVLALTIIALLTAAVLQVANEWPVEPLALLASVWFLAGPLILFAIVAVVIQTLSPQKYVGMLLVLMLAMSRLIGELAGIRHPLARFASPPDVAWSDMSGFGRTSGFQWSMLYWSAIAAALLLVATARWRGRREPIAKAPAVALLVIAVASGAFIAMNTNTADLNDWREDYERSYKRFASLPRPRVTAVRADFELHPEEYWYRVRGTYVLRNDGDAPIDEVLVTLRRGVTPRIVKVSLGPRQQAALHFDVTNRTGRLESADYSFIHSGRELPLVGYVAQFEMDDPRERRKRGLPPVAPREEREIPVADWVSLDLTVSTAPDHTVVAPGRLQRTWIEGGRRHAHFVTETPVAMQFGIGSARYAVTRAMQGNVAVELYHHPTHTVNVPKLMRAATESLALYERSFGPYRHAHLRVAEVSGQFRNFSGFAQPGVVFLGENRGFLLDARDPRRLDLGYRRLAHEIAHQWWGYTLIPADVPGATALTESLTKYSELLALEKAYGIDKVRQSLEYELDYYLSGRTAEAGAEPPLAKAGDQAYLYYRKGALITHAIGDLIGRQSMNAALRNLIAEQGGPSRKPTTAHLVRHLKAVAAPQHHALIDEWMNDVVLYDLRLDSATARQIGNRYEVTLRITAAKTRASGEALPMNEPVAVAVDDRIEMHAIRSGTQQVTVITSSRPTEAAVDPNLTRVDTHQLDNRRPVNIRPQP